MIELHRAKMLQESGGRGMPSHSPVAVAPGRNVPQHTAVSTMQNEDQQMQRFLNRMQRRDDSQQSVSDSTSGPTVPTALSRRMLQRQGVGYLDDTVAAITSASADRFVATVLHQAVACRDQRLKGAEMARESRRHRKRHMEQYQADADDRRRRKLEHEQQREKANLAAIAAADSMKRGGAVSKKDVDGTAKTTTKKKKKKDAAGDKDMPANGIKKSASLKQIEDGDDEDSYDSLDEEEEFYQNYYGDPGDSDESDEEDETLKLTDLTRPLEAWDFHIAGKLDVDDIQRESDYEESDDENEDDENPEDAGVENGEAKKDSTSQKVDATPSEDGADVSSPKRPTKPPAKTPTTPNPS